MKLKGAGNSLLFIVYVLKENEERGRLFFDKKRKGVYHTWGVGLREFTVFYVFFVLCPRFF